MLNNRDKAIIASIHIRSAIRGLKDSKFYTMQPIIHIDSRCYNGEKKFQKAKPYRYHELQAICKLGSGLYDKVFKGTEIATDTFITELYYSNEHELKNYFKLKDKTFGLLFKIFGEDDDCEEVSINAARYVTDCLVKAEELYEWQLWVMTSNLKQRIRNVRI